MRGSPEMERNVSSHINGVKSTDITAAFAMSQKTGPRTLELNRCLSMQNHPIALLLY